MAHGLDGSRMSEARGIAGSYRPEQQGCFLVLSEIEADWFIQMNNTGGPVDVWRVVNVDENDLVQSPEGHLYLPAVIPRDQIELLRVDVAEPRR
jgi:hypothetical protein